MLPPRLERPAQSRPGRAAGSHAALAAAVRAELAAQPGRLQLDPDLIANTRQGLETRMRMGASLGRRPIGATEE